MAGSVFRRCRRMSPAGGALAVALVAAAVVAIRVAGAAEPAAEAILDLPGGSALPGALLDAPATDGPRGTIRWQSPLFTEPFEFHLDEIVGVRFSRPWNPADAATFRFHLRGGDMLEGELEGIDADHVIMIPRGAEAPGRVRIRRWAVEAISRVGGAVAGTYVGPGGLAGWRITPQSAWRAEAGRIAANRPGTATLDVGGAGRARYDVVLSWRSKPDVRISVAAATLPAEDAYRVELIHLRDGTPEAAVVREEAERAALEPLAWGDAGAKSLHLVIFVDQEKGRLAVAAGQDKAGTVTDIAVPPWPGRSVSGLFRIALGSGDVVLESLRVAPWTTPDPTLDDRSRAAVVTKTGGRTEAGVASFDKAGGELVLAGGERSRQASDRRRGPDHAGRHGRRRTARRP